MVTYAAATTGQPQGAVMVIDTNHPYYLRHSDNPGMMLVTQLLTDQNYNQWKRSIMLALSAKYKLGMIDGSLPRPASTSALLNHWTRCNDMVISWLLNSVSVEIRNNVVYLPTAKMIWDDLAARFSQSNVPRLFNLRKDTSSLS